MNRHYQEIAEKRKILRELYGGMMLLKDLGVELGAKDPRAIRAAAAAMGIEPTQVGRSVKYDTDAVAKRLVEMRGIV